jgi:hypothetical protein
LYTGIVWGGSLPDGRQAFTLLSERDHDDGVCDTVSRHVVPGFWQVALDDIRRGLDSMEAFGQYMPPVGEPDRAAIAHRDRRKWTHQSG